MTKWRVRKDVLGIYKYNQDSRWVVYEKVWDSYLYNSRHTSMQAALAYIERVEKSLSAKIPRYL